MSNEIIKYESDHGTVELSEEIVKKYLVSGDPSKVTNQELSLFMRLCQYQRLNPFIKEAYLIKFGSDAQMIVGKDVFVKRAEKHEKFKGYKAGIIVEKDGKIDMRDGTFYLKGKEQLVGGWAEVYRSDRDIPLKHTVAFDEFFKNQSTWKSMPGTMIRKVALVQVLREAFPEDLQGLYDSSEMGVDTTIIESVSVVSNEQRRAMFEVSKENADIVRRVLDDFGYKNSSEVRLEDYEKIIEAIKREANEASKETTEKETIQTDSGEVIDAETGEILISDELPDFLKEPVTEDTEI